MAMDKDTIRNAKLMLANAPHSIGGLAKRLNLRHKEAIAVLLECNAILFYSIRGVDFYIGSTMRRQRRDVLRTIIKDFEFAKTPVSIGELAEMSNAHTTTYDKCVKAAHNAGFVHIAKWKIRVRNWERCYALGPGVDVEKPYIGKSVRQRAKEREQYIDKSATKQRIVTRTRFIAPKQVEYGNQLPRGFFGV